MDKIIEKNIIQNLKKYKKISKIINKSDIMNSVIIDIMNVHFTRKKRLESKIMYIIRRINKILFMIDKSKLNLKIEKEKILMETSICSYNLIINLKREVEIRKAKINEEYKKEIFSYDFENAVDYHYSSKSKENKIISLLVKFFVDEFEYKIENDEIENIEKKRNQFLEEAYNFAIENDSRVFPEKLNKINEVVDKMLKCGYLIILDNELIRLSFYIEMYLI